MIGIDVGRLGRAAPDDDAGTAEHIAVPPVSADDGGEPRRLALRLIGVIGATAKLPQ